MTKKDYVSIADILEGQRWVERGTKNARVRAGCLETLDELTLKLATLMESDNEAFDNDRFLTAAGYKSNPSVIVERLAELEDIAKTALDQA